ncbi:enoyl-CoA hydratase/isomerase family protein [Enhydrobacter sp.]|jgi:enoyl-CoA hydratase/carnithine racemase|uniref:enoyl-CoA hydratase/isomerase family protein n=1 Tax=Enhydrobacter sp. TaxID=1894999 RepID=UPI00261027B4|nr:enoyl-CoA hydratase/isomerase family protein [Enhydrobacter sp.]WIM12214.1 MAG: Enoyl-CoA hydratase [Enhydrobacter sp.]
MTQELLYDKRGDIGWITFNRPQARNALTFAMYEGLAEICGRVAATHEAKVLVITGAGDKAFAAGTDIGQFKSFKNGDDGIAYERKMDRILDAVERCAVPTIAAIAGYCTGGGAGIAAVCDFRIASASAQFGFPIARTLGNCLSMANYARLASLIGPQRVKEMILLARLVDASTALQIGLVSEVLPDVAALQARAEALATTLAGHAPLTMRSTKEALRRLQAKIGDENIDDLIRHTYGSADFREGMSAFLEKRPPKWSGR